MTAIKIVGVGGSMKPTSRNYTALQHALQAARNAGANTELFNVRDLNLPMYDPAQDITDLSASARAYLSALKNAHGIIIGTSAYHGTLSGITKNAIDYMEYLSDSGYLDRKAVGVLATAGGTNAGPTTVEALVHCAHALRGTVIPLQVAIPQAGKVIKDGKIIDEKWANRLSQLGALTVNLATVLSTPHAIKPATT